MFSIDNNITELNIREKNILKMLFSMNVHQVATPEMILEDAKSYILFFRESPGMVSAYIALYLTVTNRRLYYVHSSNPFPEGEMATIEQEALEFAEGLGAMLDEKDFSKITLEEKNGWIDAQELFNLKAAPEPSPQPAAEVQTATEPVPQTPSPPPIQEPAQAATAASSPQAAPPQQEPPVQRAPVQPVPQVQPASAPQPEEVEERAALPQQPERPAQQSQRQKTQAAQRGAVPSADAARKQQEILQKAIKEGIAKPPKQSPPAAPASSPSTGVVSRDREALARLLTSF
jgi:hypothetical protein